MRGPLPRWYHECGTLKWYTVPSELDISQKNTLKTETAMSFVAGAGTIVQVNATDAQSAYLVTPGSHIGRVVTGVVLLCEAPPVAISAPSFSLASTTFADKLAEQGYKVLVITAANTKHIGEDTERTMTLVAQSAAYLRDRQDIQRVALLGYGAGADVAVKIALEQEEHIVDCFIALSPDGRLVWTAPSTPRSMTPILVLAAGKTPFAQSESLLQVQDAYSKSLLPEVGPPTYRARVFPGQAKGFAFSAITDEDAATQAIAEVLDWLMLHLHRFRVAAATSDIDPWWPQGRNGPFCNIGQQRWQEARNHWLTPTHTRPPRPPSVPSHLLFDGLSSMRRTFDLPHRMALGDIVELFVEIWEVQQ